MPYKVLCILCTCCCRCCCWCVPQVKAKEQRQKGKAERDSGTKRENSPKRTIWAARLSKRLIRLDRLIVLTWKTHWFRSLERPPLSALPHFHNYSPLFSLVLCGNYIWHHTQSQIINPFPAKETASLQVRNCLRKERERERDGVESSLKLQLVAFRVLIKFINIRIFCNLLSRLSPSIITSQIWQNFVIIIKLIKFNKCDELQRVGSALQTELRRGHRNIIIRDYNPFVKVIQLLMDTLSNNSCCWDFITTE